MIVAKKMSKESMADQSSPIQTSAQNPSGGVEQAQRQPLKPGSEEVKYESHKLS